jgi:creatinine amidohydrolase
LKEAGRELLAEGLEVYLLAPVEVELGDIVEDKSDMHAGEIETSVMLYLHPELVELEKAAAGKLKRETFAIQHLWRPSTSGVFGEPELANKSKGEQIFLRVATEMAKFIKERQK